MFQKGDRIKMAWNARLFNTIDKNLCKKIKSVWSFRFIDVFDKDFFDGELYKFILIETIEKLPEYKTIHSRLKFLKDGEKRQNSQYDFWYLYELKGVPKK